jgi:hypothetical protein
MTVEALQGKSIPRSFTNGDFFQTFGQQWALSPRASAANLCQASPCQRLDFVHNNIISKEVCRVFVLRCQSVSHLTCPVLFHRVTCHVEYIQSYKLRSYISYINTFTFIHSYIHTLLLSFIHIIHNIIHT